MPTRRKVVVVVPFLNEAENLPLLYERLSGVLAAEPEAFDVLFLDTGSSGDSAACLAGRRRHGPAPS